MTALNHRQFLAASAAAVALRKPSRPTIPPPSSSSAPSRTTCRRTRSSDPAEGVQGDRYRGGRVSHHPQARGRADPLRGRPKAVKKQFADSGVTFWGVRERVRVPRPGPGRGEEAHRGLQAVRQIGSRPRGPRGEGSPERGAQGRRRAEDVRADRQGSSRVRACGGRRERRNLGRGPRGRDAEPEEHAGHDGGVRAPGGRGVLELNPDPARWRTGR